MDNDKEIRAQALDLAVRSIAPGTNFNGVEAYTQKFISRAEMFEEYIREGVNNNA